MTPDEIAEKEAATAAASTEEAAKAAESKETPPNPVEVELGKVRKEPKTEAEKAAFTLKKNADRARELGLDPQSILGIEAPAASAAGDDDDKPVTVGMLKKMQADTAAKTAIQMASEIEDVHERELTLHYLEHTIRPSGNAEQDLKTARALVNSVKNGQIVEEVTRRNPPRTSTTNAGAPAKVETPIVLSAEERQFLGPPFNMTPQAIAATRPKA